MKILIDTNVVLDVLLKRKPFYSAAVGVLALAKKNHVQEYVSASAITDIYYISCRQLKDKELARSLLKQLLQIVSVLAVSEEEIINALESDWKDFEDSVQYAVALSHDIDAIITRNPFDYMESEIPVWLPEQSLELVKG